MKLRALRDDDASAREGSSIPSWASDCPCGERNPAEAFASGVKSGVKSVSPDDTARQPERLRARDGRRSATRQRGSPQRGPGQDELEDRYRADGRWDDLVELYTSLVEVAGPRDKRDLLAKLADVLWQELSDASAARDALIEALALDPGDDEIASYLEDIALSRDGGWTALVDAMSARILLCADNPTKAGLAEHVVRWAQGAMGDAATAERFLASMRTFDPAHPLVHRRLARMYEGLGAPDAQREALERALARTDRDEDRSALHASLGALLEKRNPNPKVAAGHYESALAIDPHCMPALEGLERICRTSEGYGRLAEVLAAQVDAAVEREDRVAPALRLAELLEKHFVRPADAVARYEQALELAPELERAADGVERCWLSLRQWSKLAAALERRAVAAESTADAIAALERLGEVRETKEQDLPAAFAAWRRVYELDTSHLESIQRLARLCEKQGDVIASAAYRARLADLADDPREKARIHVAVGEMLAPEGRDPACARIHFERAVEMDPRSAVAWEQLQNLALRERDMMYATFCLERRAENAEAPRLKAQLLIELAKLRLSLGDTRGALATYEYAFETDPTSEATARALLEDWVRREKWPEAQRACDVLVAAATRDQDGRAMLRLLRLSTRIALALGDTARTLAAASAAIDLAPGDLGARVDVLHVCHELRGASAVREQIVALSAPLGECAMDLPAEALVKLGEIRIATGDASGSVEILCLALARAGDSAPALAALADVFRSRGDWGRAASCKHRLAGITRDLERRQALFLEAADLWENECQAPARAAAALEELVATGSPPPPAALRRLVGLWGRLSEWEKLVSALLALGERESDPAGRARHLYASAGVVRERLRDPRRAAQLYEQVLDLDETRLEAFERLVRVWTELRDWGKLELSYRRMLGRLVAGRGRGLEHALYRQLGLIYRDRLGNLPLALDAFQRALCAGPDDEELRRIIVELFLLTGREDQAVTQMRATLASDAARPSTYRHLYELFLRQHTPDRAWCAASVLSHLGEADGRQRVFLREFPPLTASAIPGTLAPCAWDTHLIAPGVDRRLAAIFRALLPAVVRARLARAPVEASAGELREDASPAATRLHALVRDTAEILGVPSPRLLSRPSLTAALSVAPMPEPTLWVSLPALEAVAPDLLPFIVARRLAEQRPELLAHALFPSLSELRGLLKGALCVAVATPKAPPREPHAAAIAATLQPRELEQLRDAVSAIVGTQTRTDLRAWHQQVDLSTARVALLIAGDVDLGWRAMQCEPQSPNGVTPAEGRADMLRFGVSDELYDLRAAIGVSVEARS